MVGDFNYETNFPHKPLLTGIEVATIRKAFANDSSANTKLLKTHLSKIVQLEFPLLGALGVLNPFGVATNSILAAKKYRI